MTSSPAVVLRRPRRTALAAVSFSIALTLGGCAGDDTEPVSDRADEPTATPSEEPGSGTPSESPGGTDGSDSPGSQALPVYFVGDAPDGPRLFREFQAGDGSDPLAQVAAIVDGGSATDPDYRTLWPGDAVAGAEAAGDALVVRLEADAFTEAPDGMTRREARLALQQMVYSLQGAAQERLPVRFVRESGEARLFGLDVSRPVRQRNALRVLNHMSITSPTEGATVPAGSLEVTGAANSFEASGPCQLLRDGEVVETVPFVAEAWMDTRLFPFTATFDRVEPGAYLLSCSTDDPTGGTEGIGAMTDTKAVTVS